MIEKRCREAKFEPLQWRSLAPKSGWAKIAEVVHLRLDKEGLWRGRQGHGQGIRGQSTPKAEPL